LAWSNSLNEEEKEEDAGGGAEEALDVDVG
jgi:hypothetical protein